VIQKWARTHILGARIFDGSVSSVLKTAHRAHFDFEPKHGYLYVRSRMISSRCNDNFDEFPGDEIEAGYLSFLGKPVFVNHHNEDHRRMRGLIVDAALHKDSNRDGSPDIWTEGLQEVDALTFPKLAAAILAGKIDRTSMGVDVAHSVCSVCANKATTPLEYCRHIPAMKGSKIMRRTADGSSRRELIRERCHGLSFFENSLLVEEPADPTAYFLDKPVMGPGLEHLSMSRTASRQQPPGRDRIEVQHAPYSMEAYGRVIEHQSQQIHRVAGLQVSALMAGGACPGCLSLNTVASRHTGAAECADCGQPYRFGAPPMVREAAPRHADPATHPFFQQNPAHADHVLKMWHGATDDERESGHRWYSDAGLVAQGIGTLHHGQHPMGNTHLAAGLIANYSPQTGWAANQHNAARVLHSGKGIGGPGSGIFASTQQKKAADRMLGGEAHTSVLTSPKVSDFAHLVEHGGDQDHENPHTVIDRHALSVATGKRMSDDDYGKFPKTQRHYYGHVVDAYHQAAKVISDQTGRYTPAHAVQAATWLAQQRHNQIGEQARADAGGDSRLDRGRHKSREKQENAWGDFRKEHLPHMDANPGTGYSNDQRSASRGRRGR
jgi:hypothetical protein